MFLFKIIKTIVKKIIIHIQKHITHSYHYRNMIKYIKNQHKINLIGVEIGVLQGLNAISIMEHLPIKHLYLIDSWDIYDGLERLSLEKIPSRENHNDNYEITKRRMKRYGEKVTLIRKKSEDAVNDVPNNIDFIYIDGNHQYEFVKKDIELYYPKLMEQGIIGGHDFRADTGVAKAVLEFIEKHKLCLKGDGVDWWIIKPYTKMGYLL